MSTRKRAVRWGFACPQSKVSGRRLWGHFAAKFGPAENFFREHFVANFCPLVFIEAGGKNFTPEKLPRRRGRRTQRTHCDAHLRAVIAALEPQGDRREPTRKNAPGVRRGPGGGFKPAACSTSSRQPCREP
ncbi:MAG: hypothetical protein IPK32_06905 [Verrucomicrobiaceae bacterium]|nr:hypothetical protein [Verrucomicrobiaceae bacterium]